LRLNNFAVQGGGVRDMTAYEFYLCDGTGKFHLIGLLPERRSNLVRITQESVMNWGRSVVGKTLDGNSLYFIQVEL
jgi:hypothetical protein